MEESVLKNIVVIYESKYGSTKRYAEWIAKELNARIFRRKDITSEELKEYDVIIYGGGLYAGGISGVSLISRNFDILCDKKIIIFTCGLADPKDEINIKNIHKEIDKVFSPEVKSKIAFFHLRGAIDYQKLGIKHKFMMSILKHMLSK
jgi:menaquinone-dependent protoporphyrinogen IX oxidase